MLGKAAEAHVLQCQYDRKGSKNHPRDPTFLLWVTILGFCCSKKAGSVYKSKLFFSGLTCANDLQKQLHILKMVPSVVFLVRLPKKSSEFWHQRSQGWQQTKLSDYRISPQSSKITNVVWRLRRIQLQLFPYSFPQEI